MKTNNKFKIFAATTAISVIAAPVITLASCAKKPDAQIDEKEKTKTLEAGEREATFSFKLSSPVQRGETIRVNVSDIVASQRDYTVKQTGELQYQVGSRDVKLTVVILSRNNGILKEGAKFTFSVTLTRVDADSKIFSTTKIGNLTLTYAAVPTTAELKLVGQAKALSNPGEYEHVYEYDVGGLTIDDDCEYQCEIEKLQSSKTGLDVEFVEANYNKTTKKLFVKFKMSSATTIAEGDNVDFNYTLSCEKNGKEAWRQSFKDYQITHIANHLWIFDDYQWDGTLAGDPVFHLYVAKNKDLHWSSQLDIVITNTTPSNDDITFTPDKTKISEYDGEKYSYFIVPVTIAGVSQDTQLTYDVKLTATIEEETITKEFKGRKISYITEKVQSPSETSSSQMFNKNYDFALTLNDATAQKKVGCYLNPTGSSTGTTASLGSIEVSGESVTVPVILSTELDRAWFNFNLVVYGLDEQGNLVWTQPLSKSFSINFIDPIKIENRKCETGLDVQTGGKLPYTLIPMSESEQFEILEVKKEVIQKSSPISDISVVKSTEGNWFDISLVTSSPEKLTSTSHATFNLIVTCKYQEGIFQPLTETKTFKECRIDYSGTVSFDSDTTPAEQTTLPGINACRYRFRKDSSRPLSVTINTTGKSATEGRKAAILATYDEGKYYDVIVGIESIVTDDIIRNHDYAQFTLTFTGKTPLGEPWSKEIAPSTGNFEICYASGVTEQTSSLVTEPRKNIARIRLNSAYELETGEYYKLSITDQAKYNRIIVEPEQETIAPLGTQFDVELKLAKEDGQPLLNGETTTFCLVVEKCAWDGTTINKEKIGLCRVTYHDGYVTWDRTEWCAYETVDHTISKPVDVGFHLSTAISDGQRIDIETAAQAQDITICIDSSHLVRPTKSGKFTLPIYLKTINPTQLKIGDLAKCNLVFKCVNTQTNADVWTETINGFYMYMLSNFTFLGDRNLKCDAGSIKATINPIIMQAGMTDDVTIIPILKNIKTSKTGLSVIARTPTIEEGATQFGLDVYFAGSVELEKGDSVTFDLDLLVSVTTETFSGTQTFNMGSFRMTKTAV